MSWPWRPNTWEKGLRRQVRVSSIAELLQERKVLCFWRQKVHWGSASECGEVRLSRRTSPVLLLPQLIVDLPLKPLHDLLSAFPSAVICLLRLSPSWLQISQASGCFRCCRSCRCSSADGRSVCVEVALSLLISAPAKAQYEQSKREEESSEEKPAAEKRQTFPPDESENRDGCVHVCECVCAVKHYSCNYL